MPHHTVVVGVVAELLAAVRADDRRGQLLVATGADERADDVAQDAH